jgi:chromosome partitioning protein
MSEPRFTNETTPSAPVFSSSTVSAAPLPNKKAYVIVLGNEKGGSGKTTTCMHLIVSLLRLGFTVGTIDIDARQRSLSRYLENRRQTMLKEGVALPQPQHIVIQRSPFNIVQEAEEDERERFTKALSRLVAANDFIVVDSPGSDTFLARVAHAYADTVITPINDSFVDLDVLATVDGQTMKIIKPSIYSEMVWEQKLQRAKRDGGSIEWIVMRNRLSNIDAKNKRFMTQVTTDLSRRIGFRVAPGFSERVIFREMFLQGLTVLDIMEAGGNASLSMSHVAARQEVRDLLKTLNIPLINERINKFKAEGEEEKPAKPAAAPVAANEPAAIVPATAAPVVSTATQAPAPAVATPVPALDSGTNPSAGPVLASAEPAKDISVAEVKLEAKVEVKETTAAKVEEKILEELAS